MMKSAARFVLPRVLLLVPLAAALAACGGGGGGADGLDPSQATFEVVSVTPADGSQGVDVESIILVTFSDEVDPASVLTDSIRVGVIGTGAAQGTTSMADEGDGRVVRWVPQGPMAAVSTHAIIVDSSVRSLSGARLARDLTYTFRTAGGVAPPPLPDTDQLRATIGKLNEGRHSHSATLLANGRVLIAGGFRQETNVTDTAELYANEAFSSVAAAMTMERANHTATRLNDGRVLLAGGVFESAIGQLGTTASAELYNPSTGSFSRVGEMSEERTDHAAVLLPDGRVLITGGSRIETANFYIDHDSAEVFDPSTNAFTTVNEAMLTTRYAHVMELTGSGRVVLVGGSGTNLAPEYFDVDSETFHTLTVPGQESIRIGACSAVFESGAMCVAGGNTLGTVLYVDSDTSHVQNTGSPLDRPRSYATATCVADDRILVAGGFDQSQGFFMLHTLDMVIEGGIGGSRTFSTELRFPVGLALHTATQLADGKVLFCGGLADQDGELQRDGAYIFTP